MFPQFSPQGNSSFTAAAPMRQNVGLLGNQPTGQNLNPPTFNSTAPSSSSMSPAVSNMITALKGGK